MMRVLVVAQLLGALGLAAGGTAGALLAEHLTGNPATAGLPLSLLVLGSGVGAVAVARIMRDHGRRAGLAVAYPAGTVGAALVVAAAAWGSWPLLLAGSLLLGGGNAAVVLARYAAADLASRRGRAISIVVTAASVGAIAGPNLLGPAGVLARAVALPAPTGLFLLAVPAFLGAALVLVALLRPDPLQVASSQAPPAEEPAAADGRGELAALLGDRHVSLALLLLAAGAVAAVAGAGRSGIIGALLLLGVGWNAGLIGGSALLRDAHVSPSLRTRAEGLGGLGMGAAAAAGGSGAGLLLATGGGFGLLGLVVAAPCLLLLAAVATTHKRHPDNIAGARSDHDNATYLSVKAMPE
jgi:Major Facilitator Superfamily